MLVLSPPPTASGGFNTSLWFLGVGRGGAQWRTVSRRVRDVLRRFINRPLVISHSRPVSNKREDGCRQQQKETEAAEIRAGGWRWSTPLEEESWLFEINTQANASRPPVRAGEIIPSGC